MKTIHCFITFLCFLLSADDLLAIEGLPTSLPVRRGKEFVADLRIRETIENGQRRLVFMTSVNYIGRTKFPIFNPFGKPSAGRPYRVVLIDMNSRIVRHVIESSSALATPPDRANWVGMQRGGLVGQCYWTPPIQKTTTQQNENEFVNLPAVPAGRYSLVLVVTERMFHSYPNTMNGSDFEQSWKDSWNNPEWDEPCCASEPVMIDVDGAGNYEPVQDKNTGLLFESLESDAVLDPHNNLRTIVRLAMPSESWVAAVEFNLFATRVHPVHMELVREDGAPFDRHIIPGGTSMQLDYPKESHFLLVPRGGIIGGVRPYVAATLAPGKYLITVEIDESIYRDKLFMNGKRVIPESKKWPVAFRSRTTVITVPQGGPG